MREAVRLADNGLLDSAEEFLAEYWNEEQIRAQLVFMLAVPAFDPRRELAELALEDYLASRYHSCVPVVLSILDGTVNDTNKQRGFFSEKVDLTAWDSISAHSEGLMRLSRLLYSSRLRTSTDRITIPYRNGILHGRDVNYANKLVAAKCWAALFSIRDWAIAIRDKRTPVSEAPPPTFSQSMKGLSETLSLAMKYYQHKKNRKHWRPRSNIDLTTAGYGTPEAAAKYFLEAWVAGKYGLMAALMEHSSRPNDKKLAGELRRHLDQRKPDAFDIRSVADCDPSVTQIEAEVRFKDGSPSCNLRLPVMYVGPDQNYAVFPVEPGKWMVHRAAQFMLGGDTVRLADR